MLLIVNYKSMCILGWLKGLTNCIEKCATVKAYEKIIETNLTLKSDSLKDFIDENPDKEATDAEQKR